MSRDYADCANNRCGSKLSGFKPWATFKFSPGASSHFPDAEYRLLPGRPRSGPDGLDGLHRGVFQAVRGLLGNVDALVAPHQHDLLADRDPGGARDHHPVFRRRLSRCLGIFLVADFRGLPAATQSHPQCGHLRSANLRPHEQMRGWHGQRRPVPPRLPDTYVGHFHLKTAV
jgi:hypothetical protein